MTVENENERKFLIGLEKLTRETGIAISGCGCCGSPFMSSVEKKELSENAGYGFGYGDSITWISPDDEYNWEEYSGSIIKFS